MSLVDPRTVLAHVYESELLARYNYPSPIQRSHLEAARYVTRHYHNLRNLHPHVLHCIIGQATPHIHPGQYRDHEAEHGGIYFPRHDVLPGLMEEWWESVLQLPNAIRASRRKESKKIHLEHLQEKTALIWTLHHTLLCIRPYADMNGRVARLFLNGLRLHCGLHWYIVRAQEKDQYQTLIEAFDTQVFRKRYVGQDIYPSHDSA